MNKSFVIDNTELSWTIQGMIEFKEWPKIARLSRECVITEKIDGTNASIYIGEGGEFLTGSRTRWITPEADNYGFSKWTHEHKEELMNLGPGHHFGEWWGNGCQRGYGLEKGDKRWSLFNVVRWCDHDREPGVIPNPNPTLPVKYQERVPACVSIVPVLYRGVFDTEQCIFALDKLRMNGSFAAPGYPKPEGIVVFHIAGNVGFKKTIENDDQPKGGN